MMISTLKQVAMAEKLSIPQLQQAVKNGTIESWIGIPMIQERMKDQKQAQSAAAAQQPKQPPIAEQVLMEASGVGGLPSNLPEQYAHGGIIGYAEGGETDEAYQQYLDDADEEEFQQYAEAMLNKTPDVEKGLRNAPSMSYGQVQGQQLRAARQPEGGINNLISDAASKQGIPAELASRIAMAEGGGKANAKDPRSSAKGAFGMLDSTWRSLGGTEENRYDPTTNAELGTKLIRQNAEAMKKSLGRDPSYSEVYAAHHFGTGVSKMLKGASPDTPIERGLSMFESPKRVKLIMEQNPYLKGKTVGDVMNRIEGRMGDGIVSLAQGGIAHFAGKDESLVKIGNLKVQETDDPNYVLADGVKTKRSLVEQSAASPWNTRPKGEPPIDLSGAGDFVGDLKTGAKKTAAAAADIVRLPIYGIDKLIGTKYMDQTPTPFYDKYIRGAESTSPEEKPAAAPTPKASTNAAAPTSGSNSVEGGSQEVSSKGKGNDGADTQRQEKTDPYNDLMQMIRDRMAKREEEKNQDKWMGLLSAGLGMMGGTSPYGAVNVGQGAMYGLQQYGQARKQAGAEEAADLKNLITASRYKDLGEYYKQKGSETLEYKNRELTERERATATNQYKAYADMLMDNIRKEHMLANGVPGPGYKAAVEAMNKDPYLLQLRNRAFGQSQFKLLD